MWNYPEEYLGKPNNLDQYYKTKPTNNEDDGGGLGLLVAPLLVFVFVFMYYALFLVAVPFLPVSIIIYEFTDNIFKDHTISMIAGTISFIGMIVFLGAASIKIKVNELFFWSAIYALAILSLLYLGNTIDNRAAIGSIEKLNDLKDAFLYVYDWILLKLG